MDPREEAIERLVPHKVFPGSRSGARERCAKTFTFFGFKILWQHHNRCHCPFCAKCTQCVSYLCRLAAQCKPHWTPSFHQRQMQACDLETSLRGGRSEFGGLFAKCAGKFDLAITDLSNLRKSSINIFSGIWAERVYL